MNNTSYCNVNPRLIVTSFKTNSLGNGTITISLKEVVFPTFLILFVDQFEDIQRTETLKFVPKFLTENPISHVALIDRDWLLDISLSSKATVIDSILNFANSDGKGYGLIKQKSTTKPSIMEVNLSVLTIQGRTTYWKVAPLPLPLPLLPLSVGGRGGGTTGHWPRHILMAAHGS
ncbi:hypothetical protein CASFOL_020262 [Castilleja foliolosa]|uniref:Uncharacterized protein n=1 Tax=Castilleja foliolosa TaxID=1961234 RepID=A0ABD3D0C5_9LAMI